MSLTKLVFLATINVADISSVLFNVVGITSVFFATTIIVAGKKCVFPSKKIVVAYRCHKYVQKVLQGQLMLLT
jgi:hypothetical protein